ncbi:MAG: T9SS type A sorting domain-containing protein [Flavobacteriaceae bacterium]|nr:T9SS type A sorting domain-containing protein [Flavobacteriaceae bacterium]
MKNLLLSFVMLFVASGVFTQLHVSPNATSDSYIYVDDQILFVEQGIDLDINTNDATTEASIYLRNDSRLIQGVTASNNTGDGIISVYQDSNSDAYDYNFWCSPVGRPISSGNQNFGAARFYDIVGLTESNLALMTTGVNGSSSPLTISRRWFFRWIPATQKWQYNGAGNNVSPGYGFIMKGTDVTLPGVPETQNQVYDFRGRPNNGDMVINIQTGVAFRDGNFYNYSLTGNPYPSAIDLNLVFNDASNFGKIDSFHFWDEDRTVNSYLYRDNKGGYSTWIPGPGDPYVTGGQFTLPMFYSYDHSGNTTTQTGNASAQRYERLFAPIGQGFMVRANSTGTITIKNEHRVNVKEGAGNLSQFRGPIMVNPNSPSTGVDDDSKPSYVNDIPRIRILTHFGENSHYRDMLLMFDDDASDAYDIGMDATHPMDGGLAEAYFPIGNSTDTERNLVIQTVDFNNDKRVPIAFELDEQMKFYVSGTEIVNAPFGKAYLYDSLNNTYQEISNNKDAIQLLEAGTYEDRFFITFRGNYQDRQNDPIVEAQNELLQNVDFFQNNPNSQLEVNNPEGYDIKGLNIFDMSGKLVLSLQNLGTQRKLSFPTTNFSDGIYLVKLTTVDNFTADFKITVFNK